MGSAKDHIALSSKNPPVQKLGSAVNCPYYGVLKLDPDWDPLRKDPRFDKLLAELAPHD
jgi:hypothetical protein